jgi:hypothetical protein
MTFTHALRGLTVFDDHSSESLRATIRKGEAFSGYETRDFDRNPFGSYCDPYEETDIPRSEWTERAEVLEVSKATPEHLCEYARVPILNQGRRPYCWCYGMTGLMMAGYATSGLIVPHLSATSLAAKIKNYRDEGGWAGEAIAGNQKYGISTLDFWPEAVADRRYDTPEQRENAALHKAVEYAELRARSFAAVASALLRGRAVSLGLSWWGHLIYGTKLMVLGRDRYGVLIRNSWGTDWEKGGMAVLEESKATPDEAFIVRSVSKYQAKAA